MAKKPASRPLLGSAIASLALATMLAAVPRASATPLTAYISAPSSSSAHGAGTLHVVGAAYGDGFASYRLEYRDASASSGAWLSIAGPLTTPVIDGELGVWDASNLSTGFYDVHLVVETSGGGPVEREVRLVVTRVAIDAPVNDAMLGAGGAIEIRGTAAPNGFVRYAIEYRVETSYASLGDWTATGVALAGDGLVPVVGDLLGTLDRSVLPPWDSIRLYVRLTAVTATSTSQSQSRFIVDPMLRPGWPRALELPTSPLGRPVDAEAHDAPTIADLDADGAKEVLVALGELVHAFRPDGSEKAGWPVRLTSDSDTAMSESGPSAADLDGDGLLEVAASRGDRLHLLQHDGTPVAGWPRDFPGLGGGDVTLADVDGDHRPELVFASARGLEAIHVDGGSVTGFPAPLPAGEYGDGVTVGDVDGVGRPSLALVWKASVGGTARKQLLYLFDADGHLRRGWPKKTGKRPVAIDGVDPPPIMADFDGDGRLDVAAVPNRDRTVRVYHGDGRRLLVRFDQPAQFPTARVVKAKFTQDGLAAGDVTGDGIPELFVSTDNYTEGAYPYGTDFLSAVRVGSSVGNVPGWPARLQHYGRWKEHGAGTPAVGDIDGDGAPEVVTGSGICLYWPQSADCWSLDAFRADGTHMPGFPKATNAPNPSKLASPAIADLDGDGHVEIAWVDYEGNLVVWNVLGTAAPERTAWPMSRGDAAHTGALR